MNDQSDQVNDQARFAAREFVARFTREMGEALPPVIAERMLFAYEMCYLRGRTDEKLVAMQMFDELSRVREEARKDGDDNKTK